MLDDRLYNRSIFLFFIFSLFFIFFFNALSHSPSLLALFSLSPFFLSLSLAFSLFPSSSPSSSFPLPLLLPLYPFLPFSLSPSLPLSFSPSLLLFLSPSSSSSPFLFFLVGTVDSESLEIGSLGRFGTWNFSWTGS